MITPTVIARVNDVFDRCWPWLEAALEPQALMLPNGTLLPSHRKNHIQQRIIEGKALFWPGDDCALITELVISPTGLRSHNIWLAGGEVDAIVAMVEPHLENWGREHGCHQQTGNGRRGWLRKFHGYEEIGVRKRKILIR